MATVVRSASNGALMVKAELRGGSPAALIERPVYTVTRPRSPIPVYQGADRNAANAAFEKAAQA